MDRTPTANIFRRPSRIVLPSQNDDLPVDLPVAESRQSTLLTATVQQPERHQHSNKVLNLRPTARFSCNGLPLHPSTTNLELKPSFCSAAPPTQLELNKAPPARLGEEKQLLQLRPRSDSFGYSSVSTHLPLKNHSNTVTHLAYKAPASFEMPAKESRDLHSKTTCSGYASLEETSSNSSGSKPSSPIKELLELRNPKPKVSELEETCSICYEKAVNSALRCGVSLPHLAQHGPWRGHSGHNVQ